MGDFEALPPRERNLLRFTFLDESARELFTDWEEVARDNVAILRLDAGRHPDDPLLTELVGELAVKSEEFRQWWADHNVRERTHGIKRYHHPLVGDLTVNYESVAVPGDPDQTLCIYTTGAGVAVGDRAAAAGQLDRNLHHAARGRGSADPLTRRLSSVQCPTRPSPSCAGASTG